ncbi:hypothetical protein LZQ00_14575 [Sphingobacterium sp. SRCM116780]|uniref:hypothetical protein n=1 Tax=Sphingobacterium sp. SRCM116780 TaxID=2907623 RepID=UPI001F29898C|nr:hypothetical protein [Sphingobacterium sp. SRCM116780]UIR55484.1 hypothetical protein LZQ00_14575 [Sphingobacterium sp. SRCM116780]
MKKICMSICFSGIFLIALGQEQKKDTSRSSITFRGTRNQSKESKMPNLRLPVDSTVHYHMKNKNFNDNSTVPMPNSLDNSIPNIYKDKKGRIKPDSLKVPSYQDSLRYFRQDSPIKKLKTK